MGSQPILMKAIVRHLQVTACRCLVIPAATLVSSAGTVTAATSSHFPPLNLQPIAAPEYTRHGAPDASILLRVPITLGAPCTWDRLSALNIRTIPNCFLTGTSRSYSVNFTSPPSPPTLPNAPISKILIANRGEIACRVIRTAKRLGIRTVAVYSEADKDSLHVHQADESICIGPAPSDQSYLRGDVILAAALKCGAQAIHPGYGFLSENAEFARLCAEAGVEFMGPPPSAILAMGDKSAAKSLMIAAAVPVVLGYHGEDQSESRLEREAQQIGYPVLIKATRGGGGKGMRIVERAEEFREQLGAAKREALNSFGNDRVLVERYVGKPRHIEVQVFGDKHGNVVHLFERDCSVQRRHQKIIEEAPAPGVTEDFRSRIGAAAVNAAKAVRYESAGTVEFIVDTVSGHFFFMEMNTRLQVEHPVTEMISGQDLVEWQIRVANGEPLPCTQEQLHLTVRVESGVCEGDSVTVFYDPMVAKLVVWGRNRVTALNRLRYCLAQYQVAGLPTNLRFLQGLAAHPSFRAGDVDTHFIERHRDTLFPSKASDSPSRKSEWWEGEALAVAGLCAQDRWSVQKEAEEEGEGKHSWARGSGFRVNYTYVHSVELEAAEDSEGAGNGAVQMAVSFLEDGSFEVEGPEGGPFVMEAEAGGEDGSEIRFEMRGQSFRGDLIRYTEGLKQHCHLWLPHASQHHHWTMPDLPKEHIYDVENPEAQNPRDDGGGGVGEWGWVVTPMAGRVVKVVGAVGVEVRVGEGVVVLESMKMEHVVRAPKDGTLAEIRAEAGQQVQDGAQLFRLQ